MSICSVSWTDLFNDRLGFQFKNLTGIESMLMGITVTLGIDPIFETSNGVPADRICIRNLLRSMRAYGWIIALRS